MILKVSRLLLFFEYSKLCEIDSSVLSFGHHDTNCSKSGVAFSYVADSSLPSNHQGFPGWQGAHRVLVHGSNSPQSSTSVLE